MNMKRLIVMGLIVLCVTVVGAVSYQPTTPAEAASAPVTTIPAPRYQVISDMLTMESDIAQLKRDVADLRDQVGVLQLLRAHDIQMHQRERAEDLKRVASLEITVAGQQWPACRP